MDILTFIKDDEQREYLSEKKYEFSAVEAAYIVCSSDSSIKDKYDAINYIINNYKDCEMVSDCQVEYPSTIEYLKKYNSIIEKYYAKIFSEPDESEFLLQVWYIGYSPEDWIGGLKNLDEVMDELGMFNQDDAFTFKIRREWEDDYVELDHTPEGIPYKITFNGTKEEHDLIQVIDTVDVGYMTE